jgi:hypothetical protein
MSYIAATCCLPYFNERPQRSELQLHQAYGLRKPTTRDRDDKYHVQFKNGTRSGPPEIESAAPGASACL